jgi:hypothetical protein
MCWKWFVRFAEKKDIQKNVVHRTGSSVGETKDTKSQSFSSDRLHWRISTVQIIFDRPYEKSQSGTEYEAATFYMYCIEPFVLCCNTLSLFLKNLYNS